jgi:NAD(P)-dependent dehydrogenase (short-subunit alcohol dehydrogenase family)
MTYAIIGSGAIGHAIATQFARQGIDVMLANSRGPASLVDIAREKRRRRGQAAAGAVSHDGNPPRVQAERCCVLEDPAQTGVAIFHRPRERRFCRWKRPTP